MVSGAVPDAGESTALVVQRTRSGLRLSLVSITLFALLDPFANRHVLGPLYAIKAVQLAVTAGLFRVLRHPVGPRTAIAIALAAVAMLSVTTMLSGIITDDAATTPLLLTILGLGTAILLPWGVWPQIVTQVIVAGCVLGNLVAVPHPTGMGSMPVALLVGSIVAVYLAQAESRYQRERRRADSAEEEVRARRHQAELARAARLHTLGGMAAGLAHEIDRPLSVIVSDTTGSAQRIRAGDVDPAALLEVVDRVADEALRAAEVLRRIREFVRISDAPRIRTDLNRLVRDALHFAEVEARDLGVAVRLELIAAPLEVQVDEMQLEQVILHLVHNAFEAMRVPTPTAHELAIETRARPDGAELIVRDTGHGVATAETGRLFEPFFSTKSDGMGLGLPISRSIVEAHGGRLWVTPNPTRGAAFHVLLPAARGRHAA